MSNDVSAGASPVPDSNFELVTIRLPVIATFTALIVGLGLGVVFAGDVLPQWVQDSIALVGTLWLRALQMTIIPLVASLLVLGIAQMMSAARAGKAAVKFLALVFTVLIAGGIFTALVMPLVLQFVPIPEAASGFLAEVPEGEQQVPGILDFAASLIAPNMIAAAADTAMLPLTVFFALFAVAISKLPKSQNATLLGFFHALANAMLMIIGWVLWLAPAGVLALAFGVGMRSGGGAFAALAHYILIVSAMGGFILVLAYLIAWALGGVSPLRFAKALLPAQAVAVSTQSSLASLPAMLDSATRLKLRPETSEFVLPLAVAIFRATSVAMNLAVALYVAALAGIDVPIALLIVGILIAVIISIGSVSLPGSISFVVSIGPIALAMGVPIEPLALLVAVEMLPDIMRTLANVTMNVAVTSAVDRGGEDTASG
ncbi:cation:dicarboxylase symporter family transporter [Erythrobacter sp. F6033]|uniref:dicarboxylate/amino acid:cation symporter n=1 Tax=Erythrobacter sp. F6033 TaxID=2926401 RepID=UPI001FF5FE4D|nr:cation:dicarboxylase symporter family transporter [Erythrobacter sp. F6033]MCK0127328.1 dicarboxylate/amino acid:cation symporter [Erythrobacter sp. F6033]